MKDVYLSLFNKSIPLGKNKIINLSSEEFKFNSSSQKNSIPEHLSWWTQTDDTSLFDFVQLFSTFFNFFFQIYSKFQLSSEEFIFHFSSQNNIGLHPKWAPEDFDLVQPYKYIYKFVSELWPCTIVKKTERGCCNLWPLT